MSDAKPQVDLKQIPLHARHVELGARMAPFAGYSMPVQYVGIKEEHRAVREGVGIFDVSHMGEFEIVGEDAALVVDGLVTNDASKLTDGQAMYAMLCDQAGGIVDDVLVYRLAADHFMMVVNASRREEDFSHIQAHRSGRASITDTTEKYVLLAVQGPQSAQLLKALDPQLGEALDGLKYYRIMRAKFAGVEMLVSRTGYTGEDGFELYIPRDAGADIFERLLKAGEAFDMHLCGLGARDTLRLEAKFNLYGQDMDAKTHPFEAGLGWTVKLNKQTPFVGQEALKKIKEAGLKRRLMGVILQGKGMLRPGYKLFSGEQQIGQLTSGSWAPTLEESIGLGYIDLAFVDAPAVEVQIRKRRVPARLTNKPFYQRK